MNNEDKLNAAEVVTRFSTENDCGYNFNDMFKHEHKSTLLPQSVVSYCSLRVGCEVGDAGNLWQQYNFMTQSAP